ncbi:MAG: hypothetical protein M3Q12_03995 [Pseudomonadota bacterium]|nr:hypothetical protein [Pseudomonadota bacterium]
MDVHPGIPEGVWEMSEPPSSFTSGEQPLGKLQLGTPAEMNQVLEIATEKVEAPEPWRLAALGKYLLSLHRTKHQDK